jgi:hypothetical protein
VLRVDSTLATGRPAAWFLIAWTFTKGHAMKKISRGTTHLESSRRRVLRLGKEAIRTRGSGELAAAAGGSVCNTTSWSTENQQTQGTTPTTACI